MVHPQVVDGDILQTLKVAVNMLNKQLQTDNKDLPAWGLGGWQTTPHHKKNQHATNCYTAP
jgi:hypothetical protein